MEVENTGLSQAQAPNWDMLPAKGRLYIKVMEARNLWAPSPSFEQQQQPLRIKRPYCVVEFDKNEFVTREAQQSTYLAADDAAKAVVEEKQVYGTEEVFTGPRNAEPGFWIAAVWKHEASFDVLRSDTELTLSVWDRTDGGVELFLGMLKIATPVNNGKVYDHWFRLMPRQHNEKVRGDIRLQLMFKLVENKGLKAEDFAVLKVLGKGSFGKVMLVKKNDTGRIYAMKVLNKKDIAKRQEIVHTLSERSALIRASASPFLVSLKFSFQTQIKLYLVLDYLNGGELFYHLQREGRFPEELARFYTCELICGLEFLHKNGIVYRDLKPENVLLDSNGHVALTDFGLCKEGIGHGQLTNTFCGTAAYLAPEILLGGGYGLPVDWWALGILYYEMVTGLPPFFHDDTNLMYQKILKNQLLFETGQFSRDGEAFARALIDRNAVSRLGSGPSGALELKKHPYLAKVDWARLERKQVMPPFKPFVESETDTANFDPIFTSMLPMDSLPTNSQPLSTFVQNHFQNFTYNPTEFPDSVRSVRLEE